MRVLIIEDDPDVAGFIKKGFREAAHTVDLADNGIDGLKLATAAAHDIVILDLMLPGKDGFDVLREIRAAGSKTPIICLTARDAVDDRVKGLNLGADDYLSKPFSFTELMARMNALLRRGPTLAQTSIVVDDLHVDIISRAVHRAGKKIDLSPREYALLEYLGRNAGQMLSRTMILEHVWDMHQDPLTNVVDVHINRLRKKIDHGHKRPLLHTVRGVGYCLRADTGDAQQPIAS